MDPSFILDYTTVTENSKFSFIKPKVFSGTTTISVYRSMDSSTYDNKFSTAKYSEMVSNRKCKILVKTPLLTIPFDSTSTINKQLKLSFSKIPYHNNDNEKESFINFIELVNDKILKVAKTNLDKFSILDKNSSSTTVVNNKEDISVILKDVLEKNSRFAYQLNLLFKYAIEGTRTKDLFTVIDTNNRLADRSVLTKKSYVRALILLDGITMVKSDNIVNVNPKWTIVQIQKVNVVTDIFHDLETINYFEPEKPIEKESQTQTQVQVQVQVQKSTNHLIPIPPIPNKSNDMVIKSSVKNVEVKLINGGRPIVTENLLNDMIGRLKKRDSSTTTTTTDN
jgi:hypothetical protein